MSSNKTTIFKYLYILIFGVMVCMASIFYLRTISSPNVAQAQVQSSSDPCYLLDAMEPYYIQDPQQFPVPLVSILGGDTYYLSTGSTIAPSFDYSSRGAGTTSLSWPSGWAPNSLTDSTTFVGINGFNCPTTASTSMPYVGVSSPKLSSPLVIDGGNADMSIGQFVIPLAPSGNSVDPLDNTLSSCWGDTPFFSNTEPYLSEYRAWCNNYYMPWQEKNMFATSTSMGLNLSAPLFGSMNGTTTQMKEEDAVADQIAKTGTLTFTGAGTSITEPATNCVLINVDGSGNGAPGTKKIVFLRTDTTNWRADDFMAKVNDSITNGYNKYDPYKTYLSRLSFYVDLHKITQSDIESATPGSIYFDDEASKEVVKSEACGGDALEYNVFFSSHTKEPAWTSTLPISDVVNIQNIAFINQIDTIESDGRHTTSAGTPADTLIHESGHAIGKLDDEYLSKQGELLPDTDENCSSRPDRDFRNDTDNSQNGSILYGSTGVNSCASDLFINEPKVGVAPKPSLPLAVEYYRPSNDSLMNNVVQGFNVISCGYIVAGILGEPIDKAHAELHWPAQDKDPAAIIALTNNFNDLLHSDAVPGCGPIFDVDGVPHQGPMNTVIDGIPNLNFATPSVFSRTASAAPGFTISIAGSNFTKAGNSAEFTNISTGNTYNVYDISSDGSNLSFNVPPDAPPGNYTVKVGAFNSPWSQSFPFTVSSPQSPLLSLSISPMSVQPGATTTISWVTVGATKCIIPEIDPSENLIYDIGSSGSLSIDPISAETYTMSCSGQGGNISKTVSVAMLSIVPSVTLTNTPAITSPGQGTNIFWSTSNVTSCNATYTNSGMMGSTDANSQPEPVAGDLFVIPHGNTIFTLSCTGPYGGASSVLTINAASGPLNPPIVYPRPIMLLGGNIGTHPVSGYFGTNVTVFGQNLNDATDTVIVSNSNDTSIFSPIPSSYSPLAGWPGYGSFNFVFATTTTGETCPYSMLVSNDQGSTSNAVTFTVTKPAITPAPAQSTTTAIMPLIILQVSTTTPPVTSDLSISWISMNAVSCSGTGRLSGISPFALSGSFILQPQNTDPISLGVSCNGFSGGQQASTSETVYPVPMFIASSTVDSITRSTTAPPVVSITADPVSVFSGSMVSIQWNITGLLQGQEVCHGIVSPNISVPGSFINTTMSSRLVIQVFQNTKFTINCYASNFQDYMDQAPISSASVTANIASGGGSGSAPADNGKNSIPDATAVPNQAPTSDIQSFVQNSSNSLANVFDSIKGFIERVLWW